MSKNSSEAPVAPDKPGARDLAHVALKAAVSAVPIVGGPVAELMDLLQTPLQQRQYQFWAEIAERVAQLEADGRLRREDLPSSEIFLDAAARAASAAIRTGRAEKREALRNAVLNAALGSGPDESELQIFFDLVDRLTVWHLRILKAFRDPVRWAQDHNVDYRPALSSSRDAFLQRAFPELEARTSFYGRVWADLTQAGLVNGGLSGMMTETGWRSPVTTEFGNRFLSFIEEP